MSNAGQAALGVVGGIVGFAIAGPTGALYGLQLGLAVGSVVSPTQLPGTFGPRLEDKRTTTASLGAPITELFGTDALAGTVIWLGPLNEQSNTEEVGGKGGPEGETTTYTYSQSIAIGLCRGPNMAGIQRIWENGKLVFDARLDIGATPPETPEEFLARIAASVDYLEGMEFYNGSETQMPDPTIEEAEGVGNVPAYRGLCYVVYRDRALRDDQALRHPSFKFELTGNIESSEPLIQPGVLMLTTAAAGIEADDSNPFAIIATRVQVLNEPSVVELEDTYDDAAIDGSDICGKGDIVFAIGDVSNTQFWARYSNDRGETFEPRIVAPTFGTPATQVEPISCDISDNYTIVVTGEVQSGSTPTIVVTNMEANVWLTAVTLGVEFDFRYGVVRYHEPMDIWLCGGYRGIARSTDDGATWASVVSGFTNFNPINFVGNGVTIAALRLSSIWASTDNGATWAAVYTDGFSHRALAGGNVGLGFTWVRWDNGIFGVIDPGFSVATDLAGPWSPLARPANWDIFDIIWIAGQFIAVGTDTSTGGTLIGTSVDGFTWTLASRDHLVPGRIKRVQMRRSSIT